MDADLAPYLFAGLLVFAVLLLIVVIASRREKLRVQFLQAVASKLGLQAYDRNRSVLPKGATDFPLLKEGSNRRIINVMQGEVHGVHSTIFDVWHKIGRGKEKVEAMQTVICMKSKDLSLPAFVLRPTEWVEEISTKKGFEEVNLARDFPEVAKAYTLKAKDVEAVRGLLSEDVVNRLSRLRGLAVEADGPLLIFYRPDQLRRPEDLGAFMSNGYKILGEFEDAFYWTEEQVTNE